jgi:hypothetical protein
LLYRIFFLLFHSTGLTIGDVLRVGFYGFGAIGRLAARLALKRGYEVVGVVDIDKSILGKDVGDVLGVGSIGVKITNDISSLMGADVAIHATGSYLDRVFDQIVSIARLGVDVVSTCETLSYPYYRYPVLATRLDEIAKRYGVAIIGAGINPGFLFDTLVVTIAASLPAVKKIRVIRSLDAAKRREPFRKKVGVGEDPVVFGEKLARGEVTGHVGYAESIYLVALAGDLNLARVVEAQKPVPAEDPVESHGVRVEKGRNRGVIGYGSGYVGDEEIIRVEFHAYVGAPEYEEISIEGEDTSIVWRSSGTHGDLGTVSVVLNVAERIHTLPPGLNLITELLPFKIRFQR